EGSVGALLVYVLLQLVDALVAAELLPEPDEAPEPPSKRRRTSTVAAPTQLRAQVPEEVRERLRAEGEGEALRRLLLSLREAVRGDALADGALTQLERSLQALDLA